LQITKQIDPPVLPVKPTLYKSDALEIVVRIIEAALFLFGLFLFSSILNRLHTFGRSMVILMVLIGIFALDRFFDYLFSFFPDNREKFNVYRNKKKKILQDHQQDIEVKTQQFRSIMHPLVCWEYYPHSFAPHYEVTWYFGGNEPETNEFGGVYVTRVKGNGSVQFPEAYFDRQGQLNLGSKIVLYVKSEIGDFTVPQSIINNITVFNDDSTTGRK